MLPVRLSFVSLCRQYSHILLPLCRQRLHRGRDARLAGRDGDSELELRKQLAVSILATFLPHRILSCRRNYSSLHCCSGKQMGLRQEGKVLGGGRRHPLLPLD